VGCVLAGGVPPRVVSPLVVFPPAVFGGCCPSGSFVARSCYFPWIYLTLRLLAAVHKTTLSCRAAPRAARRATAPGQTLPFHILSLSLSNFNLYLKIVNYRLQTTAVTVTKTMANKDKRQERAVAR